MKRSKEKILSLSLAGLVSLFLSSCFNSGPTAFETTLTPNEEVADLGNASGTAELHFEDGEIHVNVSGLPAPAEDQEYEVVAIMMDGDEHHLGEIELDAMGMGELEIMFDENMHEITEIRVIREDEETSTETVIFSATIQAGEEASEAEEEAGGGHTH